MVSSPPSGNVNGKKKYERFSFFERKKGSNQSEKRQSKKRGKVGKGRGPSSG